MKVNINIVLALIFVLSAFTANSQLFQKSTQAEISYTGNPCVGDSVIFSHDVLNYRQIRWYFGDGWDTYNRDNPLHIYHDAGDYDVSLVVTYDDNSQDSVSITLSIGTPPEVKLEYGDPDWEIYETQQTTITAKGSFETIEWFKGAQSLTTSRTVNVNEEGIYTAIAQDANGCSVTIKTDSLIVKPPPDENENMIEVVNNIITPNADGFNDFLIIKDRADYANPILISIYNVWGDKVYESDNYKEEQWNAEGLDAGTYYYHIRSEGKQGVTGFVDVIK